MKDNNIGRQKATDKYTRKRLIIKSKREKKFVNIMGWSMLGLDLFAFTFLEKKGMLACFVFVLLLTWVLYVHMYPNLYFEPPKSLKNRKTLMIIPPFGVMLALIFCLRSAELFDYILSEYLILLGIYAVILLLPFAWKLYARKEKPDETRHILIILAAILLAYTTIIPVNYITTFQSDGHESIIVNDMRASSSKYFNHYYISANWRGEKHQFTVSRNQYEEIQEGDRLKVCLRHSMFGLHYWSVHD